MSAMTKFKLLLLAILFVAPAEVFPQTVPDVQLLTRTSTRRETRRFAYGGTVTLIGAPRGSVTVEGWPRNEVELTATIELKAPTEADLDQLAQVNTFVFDEDLNHISVLTTGIHDRAFMKRAAKNFPKEAFELAVEDRLPASRSGEY